MALRWLSDGLDEMLGVQPGVGQRLRKALGWPWGWALGRGRGGAGEDAGGGEGGEGRPRWRQVAAESVMEPFPIVADASTGPGSGGAAPQEGDPGGSEQDRHGALRRWPEERLRRKEGGSRSQGKGSETVEFTSVPVFWKVAATGETASALICDGPLVAQSQMPLWRRSLGSRSCPIRSAPRILDGGHRSGAAIDEG